MTFLKHGAVSRGRWLVAFAGLALAGCTALPPPPATSVAPVTAPAAEVSFTLPTGVQLVGIDADRLAELLGEPELRRREETVQFWRYTVEDCALDLFLQRQPDSQTSTVTYLAVRSMRQPTLAVYDHCARLGDRLAGLPSADPDGLPPVISH